jgi:hypothetical protein
MQNDQQETDNQGKTYRPFIPILLLLLSWSVHVFLILWGTGIFSLFGMISIYGYHPYMDYLGGALLSTIPLSFLAMIVAWRKWRALPFVHPSNPKATLVFRVAIVSFILVFFWTMIIFPGYVGLGEYNRLFMVSSDHRNLRIALKSYHYKLENFPKRLESLTSPIAYIPELPFDVFQWETKPLYDYRSDGKSYWIIRSVGVDEDHDADLDELAALIQSSSKEAMSAKLKEWNYAPINGLYSSGDIIQTGP